MSNLSFISSRSQQNSVQKYIPKDNFISNKTYFESMFTLLEFAHNLCQDENLIDDLLILQKLVIFTADLVKFQSIVSFLAKLDRRGFREACKYQINKQGNSKEWRFLSDAVYGVYPELSLKQKSFNSSAALRFDRQIVDGDIVGNSNWRTTKFVLQRYYKNVAPKHHKECLQVLLAHKLQEPQYLQQKWRPLWTILYLWTYRILTNDQENERTKEKWQLAVQQTLAKLDQHWDKLLLSLISFIVKQFLFKDNHCQELMQVHQLYLSIPQSAFPSKSKYAYSTLLFKDLLILTLHDQAAKKYDFSLQHLRKQLESQSNPQQNYVASRERIKLISKLLPKDQLQDYLQKQRLPFWQYKLNKNVNQAIAQRILLNHNQEEQDYEWEKIFQYLSAAAIKKYILYCQERWIDYSWAPSFITFCQSPPDSFLLKLSLLSNEKQTNQLSKALVFFIRQWKCCIEVQQCSLTNKTITQAEEMLGFNFNFSPIFRKVCLFPQDHPLIFKKLCQDYLNYLSNSPLSDAHLIFSPTFAKNLLAMDDDPYLLDSFWAIWADVLLHDDKTLQNLLQIEGQLDQEQEQAVSETQELELERE